MAIVKPKNPVNGQLINTTPGWKDPVVVNGKFMERSQAPAPTGNVVDMSNINVNPMGGMTNNIQQAIQAPTFNADDYYNKQSGGLTDIANKQKELTLAQLRASRDKSIGDINLLKNDVTPAYQQKRDETDFQSKVAANKLREMMAAQGLMNGGKNVTEQMRLNATNMNNLNDLNLQERRTLDDYDKQIRDIMDPSQEQNIIGQSDLELMRNLYDLRTRADDRAYDNDWRTADFNRQGAWHDDDVNFRNKQYDRGVFESDRNYDRGVFESDRGYNQDERWRNVDNGWKSREWQHGLDREKIDDARYVDDKAYARKMDAVKLARSGSGGGGRRGGGKSSSVDPRAAAMDNILGNVELFRSAKDAEAEFFRNEAKIVNQVGREGFNYAINYIRSLPKNFSGGKYRLGHSK